MYGYCNKFWWYGPLDPTRTFYAPINDSHDITLTHGRCRPQAFPVYFTRDCLNRWQFRTPYARVWNRDSHDSYCRHGSGKERDSQRSWLRLKCSSKHVLYSSEQSTNLHSLLYLSCFFFLINFLMINFCHYCRFAVHGNFSIYQKFNNCTSIFFSLWLSWFPKRPYFT